jgi:hypothetical protein
LVIFVFLTLLGLGPASGSSVRATVKIPASWPAKQVATIPDGIGDLVMAPGAFVALGTVANTGLDSFSRLYEVNLVTGKVTRGSLVFNGGSLVQAGSSIAYVEPRTEPNGGEAPTNGTKHEELRFLRSGSAETRATHYLPLELSDPVAPVSPSVGAVWAGAKGSVVMVSTSTDKVLRTIALPEPNGQFSVSLFGSTLYAISIAIGTNPIEVYEVSLTSGKVTASESIAGVGGYVTALPGGVWLSYRTGMLGTAELFSSLHLRVVSGKPSVSTSEVPVPGSSQSMGIEVTVTGSTAWLVDISAVACVNATTGRVLADAALSKGTGYFEVIGAIGHHLYAAVAGNGWTGTRIVEVKTPAACWP